MSREHLLIFPDRETAEEVAEDLAAAGFGDVRVVREALAGEDDAEDHEWAVHVATDDGPYGAPLRALAADHGGWYDPME